MQQHLIVYAKRPFPGYAKTRLGASLGMEQAAGVYARLLYNYLINIVRAPWPNTKLELSVAAETDCAYFESAFPELLVRPQVDGDLGTRMANSFQRAFREGADSVILTGSDIPDLTAPIIQEAFSILDAPLNRAIPGVIGPAADGGYYLIGMRAPGADLFEEIAWSTPHVLAQTRVLAIAKGIRLAEMPQLSDLDRFEDYIAWRTTLRADG